MQTRDEGWRQVDHTADLALALWAGDEARLLVLAAQAVTALMTDGASVEPRATLDVAIDGLDPEDRLVQWLNEVIYRATVEGFVVADAAVALDGAGGLRATLRGEPGARDRVQSEVKAATYHDLHIARDRRGCRTVVVLDV
ncbi:MAG: archease [Myxococcales bacterium]|nr:archease [Myxococcales bacterium]